MADISATAQNVLYALNALTTADLAEWTEEQIYAWMDDELTRLARERGLFVERSQPIPYTPNQPLLALPSDHLATLRGSIAGMMLQFANVHEVEGLDDDWEESNTYDNPWKIIGDALRTDWARLYPIPLSPGNLQVIYQRKEPQLTSSATVAPQLPEVVADMLALRAIAEARRIETDAQLPEVVDMAEQLLGIYDQVVHAYWGEGV